MSVNTLSEFHPSSLVWACQSDSPVYPWLPPAHRQTRACHWLQYHSQSLDGRFTTISKRKQSNFWNVTTHNFFNKSSYQTDRALKSWPTICLYGCQCSPVCSGVSGTFHKLCRKLPAADRSAATPSCCASLTWEHSQLVGSPPTWSPHGNQPHQSSLQVPEEEMADPLIGQSLLDQEPSQGIVQVHLVLQHLQTRQQAAQCDLQVGLGDFGEK